MSGKHWVGLCVVGLLVAGCETTHTPANSNTSWLGVCEADDDCSGGLECLCGSCSLPCESAAQCSAGPDGLSCESTRGSGLAQRCGAQSADMVSFCAARCSADAECGAIGDGLRCSAGLCVATGTPAQPDGGGAGSGGQPDATVPGVDAGTDAASMPVPGDSGLPRDASVDGGNLCADGDIVDSELDCLVDDAFCRELPDGRFCTGAATCPSPQVRLGSGHECPEGASCSQVSEGLICQTLPLIGERDCAERGGRAVADPGDRSLYLSGCPDDRAEIAAWVGESSAEPAGGGLCCALTLADCAPHEVHFIGTCEPAPRYYWAGNRCVGLTGCQCDGPHCYDGYATEAACSAEFAGCRAITRTCGGESTTICAATEYCAYVSGCGFADEVSVCMPRPEGCDDYLDPVCGCDGETYGNLCSANIAGTGILRYGACD